MKNSKIYLKVIIVLSFVLVLILLFPPYTIDKKDIKFFDFVFSSEIVRRQLSETYSYSIDSRKEEISEHDTIDAIEVNVKSYTDTIFYYTHLKKIPDTKYKTKSGLIISPAYDDETLMEMFPGYILKEIDYIGNYTITDITKHYYAEGNRKLLVSQLIIEILIAILFSIIISSILIFLKSKSK